ncbi:YIEGIA family protein [Alkaliphilus crotonatoxidans]
MNRYYLIFTVAFVMGTVARLLMMRVDYRQYPTYPQAYLSHITLGMLAAGLGAVAIPAFLEKEYAAITFLSLAAQQFREVRNMERQSLDNIEPTELVARGTAYIEDIAKAFEARNYLALLTALTTGAGVVLGGYFKLGNVFQILCGIIAGSMVILIVQKLLRGQAIEDIAEVRPAKITFDGPLLEIAGVKVMNIGLIASRKIFLERGTAVEIVPKDEVAAAILANVGQRQAIQHNASTQLGIRKDLDEPDFTPIARRNPENGNVVMAIITMTPNTQCLIEAVKRTPVLESSKRKPLDIAGRRIEKNRGKS